MKRVVLILTVILSCWWVSSSIQPSYSVTPTLPQTTIKLFPNPAVDYFTIETKASFSVVKVYNLLGREVRVFTSNDRSFDISDLSNGTYLVQVLNAQHQILTTKRLSKR